jgi:hypothetical protein
MIGTRIADGANASKLRSSIVFDAIPKELHRGTSPELQASGRQAFLQPSAFLCAARGKKSNLRQSVSEDGLGKDRIFSIYMKIDIWRLT